ncbi:MULTISPECIES: hypothetical protein [Tsukamurella]|uniref:Uncharacterized protein n=1 Tax=Tsukamurella columbiensis TaxID=128509 RepID=A0ABX1LK11_9ACTN|nr:MULTISPECIES: hypothetical protein [Tsukamurella]NMD57639.1 hypothetical protein [Tsukamurella columbiensis]
MTAAAHRRDLLSLDDPRASGDGWEVLALVDGGYVGEWGDGVVTTSSPFAVTIDLDALG